MPTDYPELSEFTIVADEVTCFEARYCTEAGELAADVQRRIVFQHQAPDEWVVVTVRVGATSTIVARNLAEPFRVRDSSTDSLAHQRLHYGPDVGIAVGDGCLVLSFAMTGPARAMAETEVDGLTAKRRNVVVSAGRAIGSTINVVALARAMCERMDAQFADGSALRRPTVVLSVPRTEVHALRHRPVELPFSFSVTPSRPDGAVSRRVMVTHQSDHVFYPYRVSRPDVNRTIRAAGCIEMGFDDEANPTAVVVPDESRPGKYGLIVAAWEANLFPAFDSALFEAR